MSIKEITKILLGKEIPELKTSLFSRPTYLSTDMMTWDQMKKLCVSIKADGTRMILYSNGKALYVTIPGLASSFHEFTVKNPFFGVTAIFDGEMIEGDDGTQVYYIFDTYYYNGKVSNELSKRLVHIDTQNIKTKDFYYWTTPEEAIEKIEACYSQTKVKQDGLLFTEMITIGDIPAGVHAYKWKERANLTIDLLYSQGKTMYRNYSKYDDFFLSKKKIYWKLDDKKKYANKIVEFRFVTSKEGHISLEAIRIRDDKDAPNALVTVESVYSNYIEGVSFETLVCKDLKLMFKYLNREKNYIYQAITATSITDIGAGKGGDIGKWIKNGITKVIAIEPNPDNYNDLLRRFGTGNKNIKLDLQKTDFLSYIPKQKTDAVTAMFSLTYFNDTDILADAVVKCTDHCFALITVDGKLLKKNALSFKKSLIRVAIDGNKVAIDVSGSKTALNLSEYLFDTDSLIKSMDKHGYAVRENKIANDELYLNEDALLYTKCIRILIFVKRIEEPIDLYTSTESGISPLTGRRHSGEYYYLKKRLSMLPISAPVFKAELMEKLKANDILLIKSGTGSGKSIRLPIILLDEYLHYKGKILMSEPRIISTVESAKFMAKQLDLTENDPPYVGYKYGLKVTANDKTLITTAVDAIVLQAILADTFYDIIIVDELHERNINIDCILALIKQKVSANKKTKYILMTATIDVPKITAYYSPVCKIDYIDVKTKTYDVTSSYLLSEKYNQEAETKKMIINCLKYDSGDIIVFLPTKSEINRYITYFEKMDSYKAEPVSIESDQKLVLIKPDQNENKKIYVGSLYSGQPDEKNKLATDAYYYKIQGYTRRLIFATNVAETGLTIDNMTIVIDTGTVNEPTLNRFKNILYSKKSWVNKFSVKQRCGRVGRTKPGKCYHMYTKAEFEKNFIDEKLPEILRVELDRSVLTLVKYLGSVSKVIEVLASMIDPVKEIGSVVQSLYKKMLMYGDSITQQGTFIVDLHADVDIGMLILYAFRMKVAKQMIWITTLIAASKYKTDELIAEKKFNYTTTDGEPISLLLMMYDFLDNYNKGKSIKEICDTYGFNYYIFKDVPILLKKIQERVEAQRDKMIITSFDTNGTEIDRILRCFSIVYERRAYCQMEGTLHITDPDDSTNFIKVSKFTESIKLKLNGIYGYSSIMHSYGEYTLLGLFKVKV
jgi:hypothetical protein